MAKIIVHQDKVTNPKELMELCPFGAIEYINEYTQRPFGKEYMNQSGGDIKLLKYNLISSIN